MSSRIPVLLYRRIDDSGSPNATDLPTFRAHMKHLHGQGWRSLSLLDFESYLVANEEIPGRHFLLCLENSYSSLASAALPVMREFGFGGVAFIAVPKIGGSKPITPGQKDAGSEYLNWQQIREIQSEGVLEFQPYVHDYSEFNEQDASEIADVMLAWLDLISRELERPPHYFNHLGWPAELPPDRWCKIATDIGFDFQYNAMHASYRPRSTWTRIPRLCFDGCTPLAFERQFSLHTGPLAGPLHLTRDLAHSAKRLYQRFLPSQVSQAYRKIRGEKETAFPSMLQ